MVEALGIEFEIGIGQVTAPTAIAIGVPPGRQTGDGAGQRDLSRAIEIIMPLLNSEWVTRSRTDRSLRVYVHAKQTV
jgi:hypothetical protein